MCSAAKITHFDENVYESAGWIYRIIPSPYLSIKFERHAEGLHGVSKPTDTLEVKPGLGQDKSSVGLIEIGHWAGVTTVIEVPREYSQLRADGTEHKSAKGFFLVAMLDPGLVNLVKRLRMTSRPASVTYGLEQILHVFNSRRESLGCVTQMLIEPAVGFANGAKRFPFQFLTEIFPDKGVRVKAQIIDTIRLRQKTPLAESSDRVRPSFLRQCHQRIGHAVDGRCAAERVETAGRGRTVEQADQAQNSPLDLPAIAPKRSIIGLHHTEGLVACRCFLF